MLVPSPEEVEVTSARQKVARTPAPFHAPSNQRPNLQKFQWRPVGPSQPGSARGHKANASKQHLLHLEQPALRMKQQREASEGGHQISGPKTEQRLCPIMAQIDLKPSIRLGASENKNKRAAGRSQMARGQPQQHHH